MDSSIDTIKREFGKKELRLHADYMAIRYGLWVFSADDLCAEATRRLIRASKKSPSVRKSIRARRKNARRSLFLLSLLKSARLLRHRQNEWMCERFGANRERMEDGNSSPSFMKAKNAYAILRKAMRQWCSDDNAAFALGIMLSEMTPVEYARRHNQWQSKVQVRFVKGIECLRRLAEKAAQNQLGDDVLAKFVSAIILHQLHEFRRNDG